MARKKRPTHQKLADGVPHPKAAIPAESTVQAPPLHVPIITELDLRTFHQLHFPNQPGPQRLFVSDYYEDQYYEEDDGLGYYPDGVKRTLTDEQIAIFRHSEIQRLLRARRLKEEESEDGEEPEIVTELPKKTQTDGGAPQVAPSLAVNAEDGFVQANVIVSSCDTHSEAVVTTQSSCNVPGAYVATRASPALSKPVLFMENKSRALNAMASPYIPNIATRKDFVTTETPSFNIAALRSTASLQPAPSDSSLETEGLGPADATEKKGNKKKKPSQKKPHWKRRDEQNARKRVLNASWTPEAEAERARKDLGIPYDQRNKRKWEQYVADADEDPQQRTARRRAREEDEVRDEKVELDY